MMRGSLSHESGSQCMIGLATRAIIGYGGGINLVDRITNAILDHADSA